MNNKQELPLRIGVGIILLNHENKIFVGKRIDNPENYENRLNNIPLGRFLSPDDISKTVLFLCSENANMITGENILVDGCFLVILISDSYKFVALEDLLVCLISYVLIEHALDLVRVFSIYPRLSKEISFNVSSCVVMLFCSTETFSFSKLWFIFKALAP